MFCLFLGLGSQRELTIKRPGGFLVPLSYCLILPFFTLNFWVNFRYNQIMNYKRGKPKSARAGCLLCKRWKVLGNSKHALKPQQLRDIKRVKSELASFYKVSLI